MVVSDRKREIVMPGDDINPSGFGQFEPIQYISRELGIIIINNALDLANKQAATSLWDQWSQHGNIMPADRFGRYIFFHGKHLKS